MPRARSLSTDFHARADERSPASLNYQEVQAAIDGNAPNAATEPLLEPVLRPLFAAYDALKTARAARQPLELDLPERKIVLTDGWQGRQSWTRRSGSMRTS